MNSPLASRTLERASAALQSNPIACLPEIVKLMRTLSGNSSQVSVSDLAEVIQKDTVVLAKVLAAASTIGYNPNAAPVTSIHQAIHVIGYERIRSLAMSLMLIEQTARTQSSEEQRESAALSLTAGCLAQSLAQQRPGWDPEQAFICSALRSFGRIIMTSCMLEEYRNAQKRAEDGEGTDDAAYREIFGLTPLELGYELLKAANLPDDILAAVRELPPQALAVLDTKPDAQMLMLADFSARLAGLSLSATIPAEEFMVRVRQLAANYETHLPNIAAEVPDLVDSASRQLDSYVRTFRLKSLPTRSLNRLTQRRATFAEAKRQAMAGQAAGVAAGAARADATENSVAPIAATAGVPLPDLEFGRKVSTPSVATSSAAPVPAKAAETRSAPPVAASKSNPADWQNQVNRVTSLVDQAGASPDHIFSAVIQAVRHIMDAPECLLLLGSPEQPVYRLRHGHGPVFKSLGVRTQIDVRDRTVLGVCLMRKENIMIHHAHDPKITAYLPDWLRGNRSLGAYALLPLFEEKGAYGVMLVGWPETRQIVLASDQVRCLRTLLATACASCRRLAA